MIFDGLTIHSTCRDCGEAMLVVNTDDTSHPTCEAKPTELERLSADWLDAILHGYDDTAGQIQTKIDQLETVINLPGAASDYATDGWPVFPLRRHNKTPAIRSAHPEGDPLRGKCKGECGKPGHGLYDATNNVARIERWWKRHPDHNIGLATGHKFDVIDIDPKNGGVPSFLKVLSDKRIPETHGIAITASGGMHLYVKPTGKGNFTKVGGRKGIDYRGLGGYVVAPPSTLGQTWRSYVWLTVPSPMIKWAK
jgi:hypothetical protein